MEFPNLEWLVRNALYGDISGDIPEHLNRMIEAAEELKTIKAMQGTSDGDQDKAK